MLRVRLDACVEQDGKTLFEGVPLDGVGADVSGDVIGLDRLAGRVSLWLYENGRRVGAWVPAPFEADDELIDEAGSTFVGEYGDRILLDGVPLNGGEVAFSGPFMMVIRKYVDGYHFEGVSVSWHTDGSMRSLSDVSLKADGEPGLELTERYMWPQSAAWQPNNVLEVSSELRVIVGEMKPGNRLHAENDGGAPVVAPEFKWFPPGDPKCYHSSATIGRDGLGRLNHLVLRNPLHFDFLADHEIVVGRHDWLPIRWAELTEMEVGPSLKFDMAAAEADRVLAEFGGLGRFAPVEHLEIRTADLEQAQVESFLALPNLVRVVVDEQPPVGKESTSGALEVATALAARRQDIAVTFGREVLRP